MEHGFVTALQDAEEKAKTVFKANRDLLPDSDDCQSSFAAFICYVHFPRCTSDTRILPVCQSTCTNLLNACDAHPATSCSTLVGDGPSSECTGSGIALRVPAFVVGAVVAVTAALR